MYCVKCGVKLSDTEKKCPLCDTVVYHPDVKQNAVERLYPRNRKPVLRVSTFGIMLVITILFLSPAIITFLCDMQINGTVTWSGYVIGALLAGYFSVAMPFWFRKPNPVIFVPCAFVCVGLYLLYIDLYTGGNWFLSFAFPIVGVLGLVVSTVVTLMKYVPKGSLYIFGGAFIVLGVFTLPLEFLVTYTFSLEKFSGWFVYPLVPSVLLGFLLIFFAVCRPARESLERKFFI